jgi:tetratricopeptide (TPR) repeat protein
MKRIAIVCVLFILPLFLKGMDDSGQKKNSETNIRFKKGKKRGKKRIYKRPKHVAEIFSPQPVQQENDIAEIVYADKPLNETTNNSPDNTLITRLKKEMNDVGTISILVANLLAEPKNTKNILAALNELGMTYCENKELDNAKKCFQEAVIEDDGQACYNLGKLHEKQEELALAQIFYKQAVYKGNQKAFNSLRCLYERLDEHEKLENLLKKVDSADMLPRVVGFREITS